MKKTKQILLSMLALAGMASLPAQADLNEKQIGVPNLTASYGNTTSYYPVYTMDKYSQGIVFYQKNAIGLDSGVKIKELSFLGYQNLERNYEGATIEVYLANTNSTNYKDFIKDQETSGYTEFDPENATLFYSGSFEQPVAGEKGAPVPVFHITSEEGFEYGGENLMVYIFMSVPKGGPYTTFYFATASGATFRSNAATRYASYPPEQYGPSYGIYSKTWSQASTTDQVPVMTLYYEGEEQAISANITGTVKSGLNNIGLSDATVKLYVGDEELETAQTQTSGRYSFTVDAVDVKATYKIEASKDGYETQSTPIDIKAGGNITAAELVLPKLAVPATVSGHVINKTTSQPIEGVAISFNGENKESAEDGSYSFSIANVDVLPSDGVTLTAEMPGFYNYSTSLQVKADMEFNIELEPLAPLPGEGAQVGEYTIKDYSYKSPFNSLEYNCITETIYPKEMLGNLTEGEKYSSISFFGYYGTSTPVTPTDPDEGDDYGYGSYDDYYSNAKVAPKAADNAMTYNVTIYMVDTDETRYTNVSEGEDYSSYTKLYEGPVSITEGGSATNPKLLFTAPLNKPYIYGGKNLKLIVVSNCTSYKIINFCTDPAVKANVIQKYGNNPELLEAASWRLATEGVPVFKLGAYVPTAEVTGTITDKSSEEPLKGVEVTMSYDVDKYSATTDAEGKYTLYVRDVKFDEDYALSVAYLEYEEINEVVTFTEDDMDQVFDFALVQEGEISGVIKDAETDEPVADATVVLMDGETEVETTTSDADGAYSFTFEEAKYGEFTIKVTAADYLEATLPITLSAETPKVTDADFLLNDKQSGIDAISTDEATAKYFNLQGVEIAKPESGLYIMVKGDKATKVVK